MNCGNGWEFKENSDFWQFWYGLRGPAGPAGPPGSSVELRGPVASTSLLPESASSSELWMVGASSPYVGYFWNGTAWIEAGYIMQGPQGEPGEDGVSPEIEIEPITGGHTVTITDAEHPAGQSFDVMDGEDGGTGATPDLQIGTVTTGEPGTAAEASITGTPEEPLLNLKLPRGQQGPAVPLSDAEPLVDGTASAGTGTNAAREDHRHPTDTSRASAAELATFTRPNLFANWYFVGGGSQLGYGVFPVNQRGQGTYMLSSNSYGMDRWASFDVGSKHTLNSYGVLVETNGSNYALFAQRVSNFPKGTITISFLTGDVAPTNAVRIYLKFSDNTNDYYDCSGLGQNDLGYHTFTVSKTVTEIRLYTNSAGSKFSLQAVKAELSSSQTLAHQENGAWVLNEVPDYATELAKCQAYLLPIRDYTRTRTSLVTRGRMDFEVPLAVPMAKAPSIVGTIRVSSLDGIPQTGFTFDVGGISPATARIRAYKTDHGMTDGFIDSEAVWYLSAE